MQKLKHAAEFTMNGYSMNISIVFSSFILVFVSITQLSFIVLHKFIATGFYTYKYTGIIQHEWNDLIQYNVQLSSLNKSRSDEAVGTWLCSGPILPLWIFDLFEQRHLVGTWASKTGATILQSNLTIQHYCLSDYFGYRRIHVLMLLKITF